MELLTYICIYFCICFLFRLPLCSIYFSFKQVKYQENCILMVYYAASSGNSLPIFSVRNYHYSLRNRLEEHNSHLLRGGSPNNKIQMSVCFILKTIADSKLPSFVMAHVKCT